MSAGVTPTAEAAERTAAAARPALERRAASSATG